MDDDTAVAIFAALAHPIRLAVFRRLVKAGPDGMAAGAVSAALAIPPSSLSHHLAALNASGLVQIRRAGRTLLYAANLSLIPFVTRFLTDDCCDGRPEACGYAASATARASSGTTRPASNTDAVAEIVTIYHNPACGTSRNVLAMIRASGVDPRVVEYLETPPSHITLACLIAGMEANGGGGARALLREKEPLFAALGLGDAALDDDALIDAMVAHPILINRPVVVSAKGTALCRPSERVLALLDTPPAAFVKEDGEAVCGA